MKAELTVEGNLRLEGETPQERQFLGRLHNAVVEPRENHTAIFNEVYPYRRGFFLRLSDERRRQLWERWSSIRRLGSALFHDNSLILEVKEETNNDAPGES